MQFARNARFALAAALLALAGGQAFSATAPADKVLAAAAPQPVQNAVLGIVAPASDDTLGVIYFGDRVSTDDTGLPFGGPR